MDELITIDGGRLLVKRQDDARYGRQGVILVSLRQEKRCTIRLDRRQAERLLAILLRKEGLR